LHERSVRKEATVIRYSVIIPQRDGGREIALQLPRLCAVFDRLAAPYEVLCVDDGSGSETQSILLSLLANQPAMRLWRLDAPAGASVALSVGIAAAQGEIIIAIEAGQRYAVEQIPQLLYRLSRLDLVNVRPRLSGWRKFWHRLTRIPRGLLFGLEVRQPDRLFWAARHEAVAGIGLGRGMRRYLPWLVARRGFRVGDMYVEEGSSGPPIHDAWPNPKHLLAAWWACRRWRDEAVRPIGIHDAPADSSEADVSSAGASEVHGLGVVAPAALWAGRPAKGPARLVGSAAHVRYDAAHVLPSPLRSKVA
jgi:glycosyltransferase involved in cell wall biosynthesis